MKKIPDSIIDELVKEYKKPEDILGENGLLKQLNKAVIERCLSAELSHHLGYSKYDSDGKNTGNSRNGTTPKKIHTELGEIPIDVPRDRNGEFEPMLIPKHERRINGFDEKIISMYAHGMSIRDIQTHIRDLYHIELSPELISKITDEVLEEVQAWQNRLLDPLYPIVFFDAIWIKVRENGRVVNKAAYIVLAMDLNGFKDVLGVWIENQEGAKFWLKVLTELQGRGVKDILIACVDGLKGLPQAIEAIYPKAQVQLCIVHMVRNSLKYASHKEKSELSKSLGTIYRAPTETEALNSLKVLEERWNKKFPAVVLSWKNNWTYVRTIFDFPEEIRYLIYTTNAIESLNNSIRKVTRSRGAFCTDMAAIKLIYLAIQNVVRKWRYPNQIWERIKNQLTIIFGERISKN